MLVSEAINTANRPGWGLSDSLKGSAGDKCHIQIRSNCLSLKHQVLNSKFDRIFYGSTLLEQKDSLPFVGQCEF